MSQTHALVSPAEIAACLGGKPVLGETVSTWAALHDQIIRGLPKSAARHLAGAFHMDLPPAVKTGSARGRAAEDERTDSASLMAATLIASSATMKRPGPLSLEASERAVRLARLLSLAERAFGDRAKGIAWLCTAHPLLGRATPLSLARTETGGLQVERLLSNILYDLPA
jgi:putative toxin-antitoxin system antitoxin component (TIGR02293 family)